MRLFLVLFFLAQTFCLLAQPSRLPDLSRDYRVIFADNFNYASVDSLLSPSLRKWAPEHSWGNAHWDSATKCNNIHPDNFAYRREDLHLTGAPGDTARALALDFNYHAQPLTSIASMNGLVARGEFYKTSGLVRSRYRDQQDSSCTEEGFKYGVFEFRCKVPATDGLQAAIWLWAGYGVCGNRPTGWTGQDTWEIDLFETILMEGKRHFFGTLQANAYRKHRRTASERSFKRGTGPDEQFHTYTLVWTPHVLAWYVDGQLFKRLRNPPNSTTNPAGIPDTKMSLLLSTHYQWDCKKNYHCPLLQDSVTTNDQQCPPPNDPFLIDYVRVYMPKQMPANGTWPLVEERRPRKVVPVPTTLVSK